MDDHAYSNAQRIRGQPARRITQYMISGYTLCLIGSAPANALYFSSYQACKRYFSSNRADEALLLTPLYDAASGLGAEVIAAGLWTPLDVVKQRLQASTSNSKTLG